MRISNRDDGEKRHESEVAPCTQALTKAVVRALFMPMSYKKGDETARRQSAVQWKNQNNFLLLREQLCCECVFARNLRTIAAHPRGEGNSKVWRS